MRRRNPIKTSGQKEYQVISNFNKGYDKTTYDGVLNDSTFRDMLNMTIKEEGVISKRTGLEDINIDEFVMFILNELHNPSTVIGSDVFTSYKINGSTLTTPCLEVFAMQPLEMLFAMGKDYAIHDYPITYTKLLNFEMKEDTTLTEVTISTGVTSNKILDIYNKYGSNFSLQNLYFLNGKTVLNIRAIIGGSFTTDPSNGLEVETSSIEYNCFKYININITIDLKQRASEDAGMYITVDFKYNQYDENGDTQIISKDIMDKSYLKITNYNDKNYFCTGFNIYQIGADHILTQLADSIYKPNATEVSNIGFNILSSTPLTFIESAYGTADAIKGVFLTLNNEPIQNIPSVYTTSANDKPFKIHVIATGAGALAKPKYRLNNGEVNETLNPYTEMVGTYTGTVFTCTDFALEGAYEIKITKGSAPAYIGYYDAKPTQVKQLGTIAQIQPLIKSSLYCKVINNQLVLYGGHGYIFFSEFDNFSYFPNYYNVYATDILDDEVVSINYFRQYYAVFTKKLIKRLSGSFGSEGFGLFPLNNFIGCINPHSVVQVQNNLYFLTSSGLYKLKQGYTGEGTENVEQIDLRIQGDYTPSRISRCLTNGNVFKMLDSNTLILNNFILDAFYPYKYIDKGNDITINEGQEDEYIIHSSSSNLSTFFETDYTGEDYYMGTISYYDDEDPLHLPPPNGQDYFQRLKILTTTQDKYTDNNYVYSSYAKLPKLYFGTPTNRKKFKKVRFKTKNEGYGAIPLYVDVNVDDITVLSPAGYVIRVDEDDNYIYYERLANPNEEVNIKSGAIIGELILGEQTLGNVRTQDIELAIDGQGKAISVTIYDNYINADGTLTGTNDQPFSISDIGFEFKLKKPKAG